MNKKNIQLSKLIIYGLYTKHIKAIMHFDNIQAFYRIMTSTFLLASYAAIGFILSSKGQEFPIDKILIATFLCFFSFIGTIIFWRLDLFYTERLLISHFFNALSLEKKNKWLPKVHHNMIYGHSHHGAPAKKVWFYIGCGSSLIVIMGIALIYFLSKHIGFFPFLGSSSIVFFIIIYAIFLIKKSGNFEKIMKELKSIKNKKEHIL